LRRADGPAGPQDEVEVYLEKLKEAWADGKLTVDEAQELAGLRHKLGISVAQAAQLREKAIESLRPIQKDDFEEKPQKYISRGIALSVNTNQFYMQGYSGVIDIKLENQSDNSFDSIKVEVSSDLLGRSEHWSCRLEPCKSVEKRFSAKPADAGVKLVQFRINARQADSVYAYWAETTLLVLPKVEDVKDIQIQADNLVNLGQDSEKFNIGGIIDLHIDEMIKRNKIRTAYDFMMEYRKLPPNFEMLELEFDPDRSEQLTRSLTVSKTADKHILDSGRGSLTDTASLQIESKDKPQNIVLVAKPVVTIGRSKKNDIVTRILPRSVENDMKSRKMSAAHCQIDLTDKGLFIKDNDSANGTLLDGKTVDSNGRQIKGAAKEVELAGVLSMAVGCVAHRQGPSGAAYEQILDEPLGRLWETAAKAGLNSVTLKRLNNLGADDENGCESYCLVYRIATVGSRPHCSISFADKGLEPVHAAILYLADRFYLENLSELTDVVVNDVTLSKNQLTPLSFGDRIRIARLDMKFLQRAQLFVDSSGAL